MWILIQNGPGGGSWSVEVFANKFCLYLSGLLDFYVLEVQVPENLLRTLSRPRCSRFVILTQSFSEARISEAAWWWSTARGKDTAAGSRLSGTTKNKYSRNYQLLLCYICLKKKKKEPKLGFFFFSHLKMLSCVGSSSLHSFDGFLWAHQSLWKPCFWKKARHC